MRGSGAASGCATRRGPIGALRLAVAAALPIAWAGSLAACSSGPSSIDPVDLVVENARALDVRSGKVLEDTTIVVDRGRIVSVNPGGEDAPASERRFDAGGRLVTPGLFDVHHHTAFVLGDSVSEGGGFIARLSMDPDSIAAYRERFARSYLPHGVTTVRDVGSDDDHAPMLTAWMEPSPEAPDFHPVGGALVSEEEGRTPFPGHAVVRDPADAAERVSEYHRLGYDHVKLYWRLREPEFVAAITEARGLGMNVTGHVDFQVLSWNRALDLGLRSFEHAYALAPSVMTRDEFLGAWRVGAPETYGEETRGRFYLGALEYFHVLGPENARALALIDRLAETGSTVVPTLHVFAQRLGLTWFTTPSVAGFDDTSWLSEGQRAHAVEGYRILSGYVRRLRDAGVNLAIGTDWADPGKAVLSEMLLLEELGIPMAEVFRIATLDSAAAIGVDDEVGAVEPGMRAHLVVFDDDPLEDPRAILGRKTVIKDGVVHSPTGAGASFEAGPDRRARERAVPVVEYLANEGVLVWRGDRAILVDGLFGDGLPSYPVVEPAVRDSLERARGRFAGIEAVLVTHVHRDHFDARAVARHLEANPEARLIAPGQAIDTLRAKVGDLAAILGRIDTVRLETGRSARFEVDGFEVQAVGLIHPPSRNEPVELVGYRIGTNGHAIAHLGDAAPDPEELEPFRGVDLLLAPWWIVTGPEGARRLAAVGAGRAAAFHLGRETPPREVEGRLAEGVDLVVLQRPGTRIGVDGGRTP